MSDIAIGIALARGVEMTKASVRRLGVDRAIAWIVVSRMWQALATPATLFLVARRLSPEEQGFYFTFQSIVALQIVVELGIGGVLMQFVSHEWAGLSFSPTADIVGDRRCRDRFLGLVRFGARWYSVGAMLVFCLCYVGGSIFLSSKPYPGVNWSRPWLLLVVCTSALLFVAPHFAVLEGCHKIAEVAAVRGVAIVFATAVAFISLYFGLALYTPGLMSLGTLAIYVFFLGSSYPSLFRMAWSKRMRRVHNVHWKAEFWPIQWRTAVSWIAGYLMFQFFTPVLFHYTGAASAGQMGISMSVAMGLYTVALTWMTTKAPILGTLAAPQGRRPLEMQTLFLVTMKQSVLIYAILACTVGGALWGIARLHNGLAQRFLPPGLFALLLLALLLSLFVSHMTIFLRAFKQEPLVWVNIVTGLAIALCVWQLGQRWGSFAMVVSLLMINGLLGLPWTFVIWYRKWNSIAA